MSLSRRAFPILSVVLLAAGCAAAPIELPRVVPNDNRIAAGAPEGDVHVVRLDAVRGVWFPDAGPGETMYAFAEPGGEPRIPGPLIRVATGTRVRAIVRNTLDDTLRVHGLHARPGRRDQSPRLVAPGDSAALEFDAGAPGTYFYWASASEHEFEDRYGAESQLSGAFVIDSTAADRNDRVFVITSWYELADTTGPDAHVPRDMFAINGLSWPHTERFAYTAGDSVRWRWINASVDAHPMHLHGFYFDILSRGGAGADTIVGAGDERRAVTETMFPGGTMALRWTAERPGRWLFHCHFAFHVSHYLSFAYVPDPVDLLATDAVDHSAHGMAGLVLALDVSPRPGEAAAQPPRTGRHVRVHVNAAPDSAGALTRLGYVVQNEASAPATDSVPLTPAPLVLERGEAVLVTIVNHLRAPTSVHWHGVEVEASYADGVPGFSGIASSVTPLIAPGDSFVAAFTPPRSGTFMFHSHSNEGAQMDAGLVAPLLVVDDRAAYDASHEAIVLITGDGLTGEGARVNGSTQPGPIALATDRPTRLRIVSMDPDHRVDITLFAAGDTATWRPLARDGADLPARFAVPGPARVLMGPGEIADFEVAPDARSRELVVRGQVDDFQVVLPLSQGTD